MPNVRFEGSTPSHIAEVIIDRSVDLKGVTQRREAVKVKPSNVGATGAPQSARGSVRLLTEQDAGNMTGEAWLAAPETSTDFRLRVGADTLLFYDNFNGTVGTSGTWKTGISTTTITAGGGSLLFNTNSTLGAATGCSYQTLRHFVISPSYPIYAEATILLTCVPQANQVFEVGLFTATTTTTPVDGVFFRINSDGLTGVVVYNGVELTTGQMVSYVPVSNLVMGGHTFYMEIDTRSVQFWLDDELAGIIETPAGMGAPYMQAALPFTMQYRNTGLVIGAPILQVKVFNCAISLGDAHSTKPWPHQMKGTYMDPAQLGNGTTPTLANCMTALYTNSLVAGAGVLMTNTTAALGVGLGGQFGILPTLASPTEGVVCSYQNPVGTVNIPPRTMMITGVRVQGAVTTTLAVNTAQMLFAYALCYGHTAVSLATAYSASFANGTTKAPKRIPLGFETYAATAVAGTLGGPGIYTEFKTPIVVNPGEFVAISAKNLIALAGVPTGVINVLVSFDAYFV